MGKNDFFGGGESMSNRNKYGSKYEIYIFKYKISLTMIIYICANLVNTNENERVDKIMPIGLALIVY